MISIFTHVEKKKKKGAPKPTGNKSRHRPKGLYDRMYQDQKKCLAVESPY